MDRKEFLIQMEKNFRAGLKLVEAKNTDYASGNDPFKNFRAAEMLGMTLEQGILLRMSDKMARIGNLLKSEQKVTDESIEDTLLDLMNYANILLSYQQSKQN